MRHSALDRQWFKSILPEILEVEACTELAAYLIKLYAIRIKIGDQVGNS